MATGFLRMGPWDNAMVKDEEARQIYRDDLVNNIGQTFLATTLRCFKCHDHKFDPLPTRDYYRIYAAISARRWPSVRCASCRRKSAMALRKGRRSSRRMLAFASGEKNKIVEKRETAAREWFKEHNLPYKIQRGAPEAARRGEAAARRRPGLHVDEGQLKVREQDEWIWQRALERYEPMVQSVYDGPDPKLNFTSGRKLRMADVINANWRPESHIFTGGSLEAPGEKVQPGVLSAIGLGVEGAQGDPYLLPEDLTGRRLGLAKWIANARNPLTTRSIVNRIWQYHFGKPIASTPNNFGVKGGKPTHPELLDWLTADFVEHGWTLKRLHKLIMMSQTYQMAAQHPQMDKLQNDDPNNDLFAYFPHRRLTAEEMRDAMLRITGELNPALGGLPIMPEINLEVALQPRMIQFSLAPAYQPSPHAAGAQSPQHLRLSRARPGRPVPRSLQSAESERILRPARLRVRLATGLHDDEQRPDDRSLHRLRPATCSSEAKTPEEQIDRAFQLALGRSPSDAEADAHDGLSRARCRPIIAA